MHHHQEAQTDVQRWPKRMPHIMHRFMKELHYDRWCNLMQELAELQKKLPKHMQVGTLPEDDAKLLIRVQVNHGYYKGGIFDFIVHIPYGYNDESPAIKCVTRIFHPAIDEKTGFVNLLMMEKYPGKEWKNHNRLVHLIETIDGLFGKWLWKNKPINYVASALYSSKLEKFKETVRKYIAEYASKPSEQKIFKIMTSMPRTVFPMKKTWLDEEVSQCVEMPLNRIRRQQEQLVDADSATLELDKMIITSARSDFNSYSTGSLNGKHITRGTHAPFNFEI